MGIDTPLVDEEGYPRNDIDLYRARTLRGRLAEIRTDHRAIMKETERYLHQLARLQNPDKVAAERKEYVARISPKPKPKYDPVSGKWVVRNWDGTVSGSGSANDQRSFETVGTEQKEESVPSLSSQSGGVAPAAAEDTAAASSTFAGSIVPSDNYLRPFARVDSVAENSPASQAGLQVDDLIVRFGSVSLGETDNPMQSVGQIVPQIAAQQQSVAVVVRRRQQVPDSGTADQQMQPSVINLELSLTPGPWAGRGLVGCHILPYEGE
jgi:hypothetical protein